MSRYPPNQGSSTSSSTNVNPHCRLSPDSAPLYRSRSSREEPTPDLPYGVFTRQMIPKQASEQPHFPSRPARAPNEDPSRKYQCQFCQARFDRLSSLEVSGCLPPVTHRLISLPYRHMNGRTHKRNVSPIPLHDGLSHQLEISAAFICSYPRCTKAFSVKSNLNRHEKTHTASSAYVSAEDDLQSYSTHCRSAPKSKSSSSSSYYSSTSGRFN